ncbi:MAG: transglycosylase domain-containing protein [bacterium]|nr:transglycosylase domain-containing protein [bacterium]
MIRKIFHLLFIGFLISAIGVVFLFLYFGRNLPRPEKLGDLSMSRPTRIYDRTGEVLLYEMYGESKQVLVKLEDIPEHVAHAFLAAEDSGFYGHFGFDLKGLGRAVLTNLRLRTTAQGGSTITQQLARSAFLTRERTLGRKVRELILTLDLEQKYTKDEILEAYLNFIPMGANAYGIGSASFLYFNKPASELTIEESAVLASLIRAPSRLSPFGENVEQLLSLKDYVIGRMAKEGYLSQEEAEEARGREVVFSKGASDIRAPHFVLDVVEELALTHGEEFLREQGLSIITTLDWELQQRAESVISTMAERNASFDAHNAALVAINPRTGEILALVGSKDWHGDPYPKGCISGKTCLFDPKLNAATYHSGRQPGSAFKPFVYATAFKKGASDTTIVEDEETDFGIWGGEQYVPQNFDGKFRGPVTLREALAQSLNIPAIKVLVNIAGIEDSIQTAKDLGITTLNRPLSHYGPSLVLGGGEVRLIDITSAYGVFAFEGRKASPFSVSSIKTSTGRVAFKRTPSSTQVISPFVASLITSILADNTARAPMFGANSLLNIPGVSVKTGTTQEFRDGWTIGYTKDIVVGVWTGNNNNAPMSGAASTTVAVPIWSAFMKQALPLIGN